MTPQYPLSFDSIRAWAQAAGVPVNEGRIRFAQYAILQGIASVRPLREGLVFKGGNALDFVWQPNRSTSDLDFSVDHTSILSTLDRESISTLLLRATSVANSRLGVTLALQRVRQNPPGADKHFITFEARVGYALPDQVRLRQRMVQGEISSQGIELDISLNEPIGAAQLVQLGPENHLRIATVEDIVAEKLRALLQQPIQNRQRRQDLLDIAVILCSNIGFDRDLVTVFLLAKAAARDVPVSRAAFHDPEVVSRASKDYAELEETTRMVFVPFEEALRLLHECIEDLDIPDHL